MGFNINLIQKGYLLVFEPPFKKFNDCIIKTLKDMVEAVSCIPRIETQLYLDYQGEDKYLQVFRFHLFKLICLNGMFCFSQTYQIL